MKRLRDGLRFFTGAAYVLLAFLLPLKFGSLAVMPEASSLYPGDLFEAVIITWPAHFLGVVSALLLALTATVYGVNFRRWKTPAGVTALLWSFALPLVTLIGFRGASTWDYPFAMSAHVLGGAAFVWGVYLWLSHESEWRGVFCRALCFGVVLTALLGLHQYFYGFRETMDYVLKRQAEGGEKLSGTMMVKLSDTRVFATFVSCNALAGFLLLALPLAGVTAYRMGTRFEPRKISGWIFTAVTVLVGTACFLLTKSRGAFLIALLTGGAYLFLLPTLRNWRIFLIGVLVTGIFAGTIYIQLKGRGFRSVSERSDYLRTAGKMFLSRPLAGYGWGEFFYRHMRSKTTPTDESARDPHNHVAAYLAQTGIGGGMIAFLCFAYPLFFLWKKRMQSPEHTAVFWGLAACFLHSLMDVNFMIPATFALAGALAAGFLAEPECPEKTTGTRKGLTVAAGCLLSLGLAGAGFWMNADELRFEHEMEVLRELCRPVSQGEKMRKLPPSPEKVMAQWRILSAMRPDSPFPRETALDFCLSMGDRAGAEWLLRELEDRYPNRTSVHFRRYLLELQRHNLPAARQALEKMRRLFPSNPLYRGLIWKESWGMEGELKDFTATLPR